MVLLRLAVPSIIFRPWMTVVPVTPTPIPAALPRQAFSAASTRTSPVVARDATMVDSQPVRTWPLCMWQQARIVLSVTPTRHSPHRYSIIRVLPVIAHCATMAATRRSGPLLCHQHMLQRPRIATSATTPLPLTALSSIIPGSSTAAPRVTMGLRRPA